MKIAILEEQAEAGQQLACLIRNQFPKFGFAVTLDFFHSGKTFLEHFVPGSYDLVFLDTRLQDLGGIDTAREIRKADSQVKLIFVSASNAYACESYAVRASDYLLKPVQESEFSAMFSRLRLTDLTENQIVRFSDGTVLPLRSILYTSCSGHYVSVFLTNGRESRIRITHTDCSKTLLEDPAFVICSKGLLVNLRQVESLLEDRFVMNNGAHVPISRRKFPEVRRAYQEFWLLQET